MAAPASPDDIIKILITSDNHVGYCEKDEIRGQDSFTTFEEILKAARDNNVSVLSPPLSTFAFSIQLARRSTSF
jgi:hypothetical protein